ncbi:MAG: hypothetical protein Q8O53_00830 [Candidatus Moranbacteria bacterium]|nr:hypothetical protein [Candidatus Moranbacteria bacterium]
MLRVLGWPECCSRYLGRFLVAVLSGAGEGYFLGLCPSCRRGKGLVLNLLIEESVHSCTLQAIKSFSEKNDWHPRIILTKEDYAAWLTAHMESEAFADWVAKQAESILGSQPSGPRLDGPMQVALLRLTFHKPQQQ